MQRLDNHICGIRKDGHSLEAHRAIWALAHMRHLGLSFKDAEKIRTFLKKRMAEGAVTEDVFGLNRVVLSLQACLLASSEIGLRGHALVACILRSLVFETTKLDEVEKVFGSDVRIALHAFLRIENLLDTKIETMETDSFRNLFVAQCGDMRVILLLIADCVNKMRLVRNVQNEESKRILSIEAAYIYAPLAHKLGLYTLKSELEDLSLKYMESEAYYHIKEKLNATKRARDSYIERFIAPLRERLKEEGISCHIKGRTKSIHSIWQKMKKQHCSFEGVYDLFAIRVIIDAPFEKEKELCWKVFSLITYKYESNLRRLRDWLTVPKSNGYESLHITVRGPEDKWVEVQIRTSRMDEIAEHGLAAHWRYKGIKASDRGVDTWLANIREALEQGDESQLSKSLGSDLHEGSVYVFSPKGDLYKLPEGAIVLDFAYLIHTNVGDHCVGARIGGRNVSIRQPLESGQKVEIITSTTQTPKLEWVNWVVSSRAKAKIRSSVNDLQATDGNFAREVLERKLKNRKITWDESAWNITIKKLGFKEANEFYKSIADNRLDLNAVIEQYLEILNRNQNSSDHLVQRSAEEFNLEKKLAANITIPDDVLVIDNELKGLHFQMAHCCNPVYGDEVFGFVTVSGGIKIHRNNCPNAPALRMRFPYRIVRARWAGKGKGQYPIVLNVIGQDDLGIVNNITSVISKEEHIMLRSINIDSHEGLFSGMLTILVDDTQVLNALIRKLRAVRGVKAVSRS